MKKLHKIQGFLVFLAAIVLISGGVVSSGSQSIMVYFLDRGTAEPMAEVRDVSADINTLVQELLKGPDNKAGLYSPFPPGTRFLGARREGRVVILDFDQNLGRALRSGEVDDIRLAEILTLTLRQLNGLDAFRITAGGKNIGTSGGHIDFDTPLELNPPIISGTGGSVGTLVDPPPHLYAVIDPGHGGSDPGAYNWEVPGSVLEKNVVLDIGTQVYNYVDGRSDATAYMTRYGDSYVSLSDRVTMANNLYNQGKANIFVSIHSNSQSDPNDPNKQLHTAQGIETYYKKSIDNGLASDVHLKAKDAYFGSTLGYFVDRDVKYGNLQVLRDTLMPAALVEAGFISNTSHVKCCQMPPTARK